MRTRLFLLCGWCCATSMVFAQGEQIVQLKNVQLGIADLMREAGRQAGVEIVCEAKDTRNIKVYYDCSANLNQILQATIGYYRSTQNLDLETVWNGNKVTLKPIVKIELPATVESEDHKDAVVSDREIRSGNLWKWIRSKWPREKTQSHRPETEEMGSTLIKKMDLSEKTLENDFEEVSDVDALPSRLQVETVGDVEALSDLDTISLSVQSKAAPAEPAKAAPAELAKAAPTDLAKVVPTDLAKVTPAEPAKVAPTESANIAKDSLKKLELAEGLPDL